jgi:hypothetical protein
MELDHRAFATLLTYRNRHGRQPQSEILKVKVSIASLPQTLLLAPNYLPSLLLPLHNPQTPPLPHPKSLMVW